MSTELKIKAKTLASQSQHIRLEKRRARARARALMAEASRLHNRAPVGVAYEQWTEAEKARHLKLSRMVGDASEMYVTIEGITDHDRKYNVGESRAIHLARMFIKGRDLIVVENTNRPDRAGPDWIAVERMVHASAPEKGNQLAAWREAAGRGPKTA